MRSDFTGAQLTRATEQFFRRLFTSSDGVSSDTAARCAGFLAMAQDREALLFAADEVVHLLTQNGRPVSKDQVLGAAAAFFGVSNWPTLSALFERRDQERRDGRQTAVARRDAALAAAFSADSIMPLLTELEAHRLFPRHIMIGDAEGWLNAVGDDGHVRVNLAPAVAAAAVNRWLAQGTRLQGSWASEERFGRRLQMTLPEPLPTQHFPNGIRAINLWQEFSWTGQMFLGFMVYRTEPDTASALHGWSDEDLGDLKDAMRRRPWFVLTPCAPAAVLRAAEAVAAGGLLRSKLVREEMPSAGLGRVAYGSASALERLRAEITASMAPKPPKSPAKRRRKVKRIPGLSGMTQEQICALAAPKALAIVERHARPAWVPVVAAGDPAAPVSKYFGAPWLRQGERWPEIHGIPARFVLQLDVATLPAPMRDLLGGVGLVQFFYQTARDAWRHGDGDEHALVRLVRPDLEPGGPVPQPEDAIDDERAEEERAEEPKAGDPRAPKAIVGWEERRDLPHHQDHDALGVDEELGDLGEAYGAPVADGVEIALQGDKLGGWPYWTQDVEVVKDNRGKRMVPFYQVDAGCFFDGDKVPAHAP